MDGFSSAFATAVSLIASFDPELRAIVVLSLGVSLTASACAFAIGSPLGTALAVYRFRGQGGLIVTANALLGLPPVVVGLAVYLLLSRSGPLGSFGLLFTPDGHDRGASRSRHTDRSGARASDGGGCLGELWRQPVGRRGVAAAGAIFQS